MNWLAIIAAALSILKSLVDYLHDRKTIDTATAEALLKSTRESLDAISRAQAARALVRAAAARDPAAILRDDDGFKRPD